jgi:hypothetical protein
MTTLEHVTAPPKFSAVADDFSDILGALLRKKLGR